jgi:hypothetical protein
MPKNIKVVLAPKGAAADLKESMARVIDGSLLKAVDPGGRAEEAKHLYRRMVGVKASQHDFETIETDEAPFVPEPMPVSELGVHQEREETAMLERMSKVLGAGIAEGIAQALGNASNPTAVLVPSPNVASPPPGQRPATAPRGSLGGASQTTRPARPTL